MNTVIELKSVSKGFRGFDFANNLNLTFEEGRTYGILGSDEQGARSALLYLVSGYWKPDQGEVTYGTINGRPVRIGASVGIPAVYKNLSARDNLEIKRLSMGYGSPEDTEKLIDRFGLREMRQKKVKYFPAEMVMRLSVALAFTGDPDVIILDQPTAGMDNNASLAMRRLLFEETHEKHKTLIAAGFTRGEISMFEPVYITMPRGTVEACSGNGETAPGTGCGDRFSGLGRIELVLTPIEEAKKVLDEMEIFSYQTKGPNLLWVLEQIGRSGEIVQTMRERGITVSSVNVVNSSDSF